MGILEKEIIEFWKMWNFLKFAIFSYISLYLNTLTLLTDHEGAYALSGERLKSSAIGGLMKIQACKHVPISKFKLEYKIYLMTDLNCTRLRSYRRGDSTSPTKKGIEKVFVYRGTSILCISYDQDFAIFS